MKKGYNQLIDQLLSPYLDRMDFSKCETEKELLDELQNRLSLEEMIQIEKKLNEKGKSMFLTAETFPRKLYESKIDEINLLRQNFETKKYTSSPSLQKQKKDLLLKNLEYLVYACGIKSYMKDLCHELKVHELLLSLWHNTENRPQQYLKLRELNMCILALSELCESPDMRKIFLDGNLIHMFRNDFIKYHAEVVKKLRSSKPQKKEGSDDTQTQNDEITQASSSGDRSKSTETLFYIGKLLTDLSVNSIDAKQIIFRDSELLQCFVSQLVDYPITCRGISSFSVPTELSAKSNPNEIFEIDCHVNLCFNALRFFGGCHRKWLVHHDIYDSVNLSCKKLHDDAKSKDYRFSRTTNQNVIFYSKNVLRMLKLKRKGKPSSQQQQSRVKKAKEVSDESTSSSPQNGSRTEEEGAPSCGFCSRKEKKTERFKVCGRCKGEYYCSVDHQKRHWKSHKKWCRSKD